MARNFGGKRMAKHWDNIASNIISAISTDTTFVQAGTISSDLPFTVLRILGGWSYGPGAVNVINDAAGITCAIGVFSTDAVALGGTAMPDPENEPGYPWLYWKSVLFQQTKAQQHSDGDIRMADRFEINVKSMRKVKPRESVAMVFQYNNVNGAPTVDIVSQACRCLVATG